MLLIGVKNTTPQSVLVGGTVNLGSSYRKYCKKNSCGVTAFSRTANDITLQHSGIYHVTATLVASAPAAGVVTVQLYENGEPIVGAIASESITTPTTELRTLILDYYIKVDKDCVLGVESVDAKAISLVNTGVAATFSNVVVNVTKEV